jgi:hypothetical protein
MSDTLKNRFQASLSPKKKEGGGEEEVLPSVANGEVLGGT